MSSDNKEFTEHIIGISQDGSITFLANENTEFLKEIGNTKTKRASHVEPDNIVFRFCFHVLRRMFGDKGRMSEFTRLWPCLWRVNLRPIGGPILSQRWNVRKDAINEEIKWLNENFI